MFGSNYDRGIYEGSLFDRRVMNLKFDIKSFLLKVYSLNASDIHITVGIPPTVRINGNLVKMEEYDRLMPDDTKEIVYGFMNESQIEKLERCGEVDFAYSQSGCGRYRVNIFKQRGSYGMAIRLVPPTIPTLAELNHPEKIRELALEKRGLILVTGPTGSGKSTTLAAMINEINMNSQSHIITLEDPIEYLHRHNMSIINQREIGLDTDSYQVALRAALRQDPDVILVGEMRDLETISTALTAVETGHLVFSTLHTMGAVSTIERIIDVFPPQQQNQVRVQLSNVLKGVISQQLLKRSDGRGRIAATEIMVCNSAIRNNIREGKYHQIMSSIQTGKALGMQSMDACIAQLYQDGYITHEEAVNHAFDKNFLERYM